MSPGCQRALDLLPAYGAETLEPLQRLALRRHLADCSACSAQASREDVGVFFRDAASEQPSAEDIQEILAGVRAGIALRQAERKLSGTSAPSRRRGFVAAAAALVAFTLAFPGGTRRPPAPIRASAAPRELAPSLVPAQGPATAVPGIPDSKFPADATIYDWNPGSGQPRVVWIVDRSLDI